MKKNMLRDFFGVVVVYLRNMVRVWKAGATVLAGVNMKGKQWVHKYRKEHPEERDLSEKFLLIKILRENFGRHGLTGEVVQVGLRFKLPDVFVKATDPQEVYELDGEYHGVGEYVIGRDLERAEFYELAGCKLYVINKKQTNGYKELEIIKSLRGQGLATC